MSSSLVILAHVAAYFPRSTPNASQLAAGIEYSDDARVGGELSKVEDPANGDARRDRCPGSDREHLAYMYEALFELGGRCLYDEVQCFYLL